MSRQIRVGLLILVGVVIFVVAVFTIGDQEGVWKNRYELRVLYSDVEGLLPGSPVRLAGLRVGTVEEIRFSRETLGWLDVRLSLDEGVKQFVRSDSRAVVGTLGLLGDKTVEISAGSDSARILEGGDYLPAGPAKSIEGLIDKGSETLENIRQASQHAKEIIEKINNGTGSLGLFVNDPDVYFDLQKLLALTERLTAQLESGQGSFTKFLTDSTFYTEMRDLASNTNVLFDSLTHGSGTFAQLMQNPQPYEDLRQIIASWKVITDRIGRGEGAAGQLLTNDSLYTNLNRTLDRAEALLEDFRLNPGRYIKLRIF